MNTKSYHCSDPACGTKVEFQSRVDTEAGIKCPACKKEMTLGLAVTVMETGEHPGGPVRDLRTF